MVLKNVVAFGNFKPGDTLTVPDGAVYDKSYWVEDAPAQSTTNPPTGGVK